MDLKILTIKNRNTKVVYHRFDVRHIRELDGDFLIEGRAESENYPLQELKIALSREEAQEIANKLANYLKQ